MDCQKFKNPPRFNCFASDTGTSTTRTWSSTCRRAPIECFAGAKIVIADGQDALGVAQVILVKSRGRFTGRGGWAYALVQRVDGEEDEFEFVSPVLLFIVRD